MSLVKMHSFGILWIASRTLNQANDNSLPRPERMKYDDAQRSIEPI